MKVDLTTYLAAENGITLKCLPESNIELSLLKGFGKHGRITCEDGELRIYWDFKKEQQ